jgi:hypothetical protein
MSPSSIRSRISKTSARSLRAPAALKPINAVKAKVKIDAYASSIAYLPRASHENPDSEGSWGTRLAVLAGVGLPAVGAVVAASMMPTPVIAASASIDLASDLLFNASETTAPADAEVAAAPRQLDENEQLLKDKLISFIEINFNGDYDAAFAHFDGNGDATLNRKELSKALKKLDVGNFLTRSAWVDGIMEKMDNVVQDGQLSYDELFNGFSG